MTISHDIEQNASGEARRSLLLSTPGQEHSADNYDRVLRALSNDYTVVYALDLDTDQYDIFVNQRTNHTQNVKSYPLFRDYVRDYTEHYVLPQCCEDMIRELSSVTIRERLKDTNDYYFSFETTPNRAGQTCFQAHIVKQYNGDAHFAVLGFRCVDNIVKTERRYKESLAKANQALQQQLDIITAAIPGGVKISNDDEVYSFRYVSEQFANMLGYATPEELMEASNGSIIGLAHPDDIETGLADALDQYSHSDHYATTYRVRCKDGSWKYIEDRGHKVFEPDGTVSHWNLILDKNELMEKTIALETEKRANQEKSNFLSRMSHDMRTPLNGVIGLMDICAKHPDDRALVDSSRKKAQIAANHLLSLINDTLELSRLGDVKIPLREEPFNANDLAAEIRTIAAMHAEANGIELTMDGDDSHLQYPYLVGSPLQIKRIYLNLINNAIRYNRPGGSVHCHMTETLVDAGTIRYDVTIQDTGVGMSKDFLKNIFEPFVQADHGARTNYMGTGLGMSIVKNLLDRMNGTINIVSEPNVGTTVTVSLPIRISPDAIVQPSPSPLTKADLKGIRILLAEDNDLNREIAEFMLTDEGMVVTSVPDGAQALKAFTENPENTFDIILMDIMMPVMDGIQAAKAIRTSGRQDAASIPIFAMTANAFVEDRQATREAGMNEHLSKPLNSKELISAISKYYRPCVR